MHIFCFTPQMYIKALIPKKSHVANISCAELVVYTDWVVHSVIGLFFCISSYKQSSVFFALIKSAETVHTYKLNLIRPHPKAMAIKSK